MLSNVNKKVWERQMVVGFFGDSNSASPSLINGYYSISWPDHVANSLGLDFENFSAGGTSLWFSFQNFKNKFKKFSHVVFTYTEHSRLNCLPNHMSSLSWLYDESRFNMIPTVSRNSPEDLDILKQIVKIYPLIIDDDLNKFIFQSIFDTVNKACHEHNIKLVNLFPFIKSETDLNLNFSNSYGSCIFNATSVSNHELFNENQEYRHPELSYFIKILDIRRNHMNSNNNLRLSYIIRDLFENKKMIDLFEDKEINYDIDQLLELLDKNKL